MAVGRLTNIGREVFLAQNFNATSLGLDNNGSAQPSYWAVLLRNIPALFTALNNGPIPSWNTVANLQAAHPTAFVMPTGNYTDHDIPVGSFTITRDDALHFVRVAFTGGQEPLVTWTNATALADSGGWALMTKSAPVSGSSILGIFPAQTPITNLPQNYKLRIRDFQLFTQSS